MQGRSVGRSAETEAEGTYELVAKVLVARSDEPTDAVDASMREVLNYVHVAETAFAWESDGPLVGVGVVAGADRFLRGTASERDHPGVRPIQVVIGRREGAAPNEIPVRAARFVPAPPGSDLQARLSDLLAWMGRGRRGGIDPVVGAAIVHYLFEALHPFYDGNGRLGRLLIVINLMRWDVLTEPTLTVSP